MIELRFELGGVIVRELMDRIGLTLKGRIAKARLTPLEDEVRKYILRRFARTGKPPSPEEIARELKLPSISVNQAVEKLNKFDIISTNGGEIISAYPFSAIPTPHKVVFEDGHEVYALCATDALGIHFLVNEDITVLSKCPECGGVIEIVVKDGRIDSYSPEGIIEFVSSVEGCGCTAETLCPFINFFCSEEHLDEWRRKNPQYGNGEIYSLGEVLEHGKILFGDLLE